MSEGKSETSGVGRRSGKATDGVRKMRMSNAVGREMAPPRAEEAPTSSPERAENAASRPAREQRRVRITVDASREQHRRLKIFAMDSDTDGMSVMRALLDELDEDPELAGRIRQRLEKSE